MKGLKRAMSEARTPPTTPGYHEREEGSMTMFFQLLAYL